MKAPAIIMCQALLSPLAPAQEETVELEPLVVEATRLDSLIPSHFPGNAQVIDEETISRAGARSVADLLSSVGGVRLTSFSGNPSAGTVSLRGFGENASSRVLILIDGRPSNRPDLGAPSLLDVPLSRLARIEILRGSQTARFGDHAVGGVINLVTKSPGTPRTSLEVAGGSDSYSLLRIAHSGRYNGQGLAFDYERNFTDGWRDNAASELESAALRWDYDYANGLEARAGLSWSDEFTGFPGPLSEERFHDDPRQSIYAESGLAGQYFSQQTTYHANAGLSFENDKRFSWDLPIAFTRRDQEWNFGPGSHTDNLLETRTFAPVTRLERERWSLDLGLNLRQDRLSLNQFPAITRENQTGQAELKRTHYGGFASLDWEPRDNWHLSAATRLEKTEVKARAENFIFPTDPSLNFSRNTTESNHASQIGIRWEPNDDLNLWLRYDSLYRLPSTDEIASYQGFPLSVPFNDQLKAETGYNLELGAEYEHSNWTIKGNAFLQKLQGEISYDFHQNLNVNLADTKRLGAEFDLSYETETWQASLHYTRLDASFSDGPYRGRQIFLVPETELSAVVSVRPHEDFTVQAEYQYVGSSFGGNDFDNLEKKLPSYGIVNLLLRYEPRPDLTLYARVNNLLDEHYATIKYSGVFYPAAGRTFHLGVRYEF
ncbi:TonB-dependent receptor [Verrucomicrobiaceae bacterium 227]